MFKTFSLIFLILAFVSCGAPVKTGLDSINAYQQLFKGKRVGIIANQTALNREKESVATVFQSMPGVSIGALFGPEHGFKGRADAGAKVNDTKGPLADVPVYSLYGAVRKPTPQMLKSIDVLVFDIQDIGTRYYTYISTMALAMEAAEENHIPFVVLDRPNPIGGVDVQGSVLDTAFASFVGMFPVPARYGLTIGEMANMINNEGWLKGGRRVELIVIKIENWRRDQWFNDTGLPFVKPSPNIPDLETEILYPGLCLLEGTNISEGRGTLLPFKLFGAPWIDGVVLADSLNALNLPGLSFVDTAFTPRSIKGMSENPKLKDINSSGCRVRVTDRKNVRPFYAGLAIIAQIQRLYPDSFQFKNSHFDRLCGTDKIREAILSGNMDKVRHQSQAGIKAFMKLRQRYLLY